MTSLLQAVHRTRGSTRILHSLLVAVMLSACERSSMPVVLGVAGPFGTAYGASMRQGAELAAREINANGGIRSRPLELRFRDDGANPDQAVRVAEELYDDAEVVAVVGHVNSGTMINAASIYQRGLPAVATSATSVTISRLGDWIFRVAPSDSANSVDLARAARDTGLPVAVLYQNEDYGRGLAENFRVAFTTAGSGGRLVSVDPYLPTTADFRPYLARMQQRGVGLVFIAGLEEDAARIIRQAHEVGLAARFLSGDGAEGLMTRGAEFDETLVGVLFHPDQSPRAASFAAQFRATYGREADSFAALGFDATHLLAEAARQAGPERRSIRDYLAHVGRQGTPPHAGVAGTIRFDANGDPTDKEFAIGVIRQGRILLTGTR